MGRSHCGFRGEVVLSGVVEILLARRLLLRQRSVTFHIELGADLNGFGIGKLRLSLSKLSLGLVESCLKGPGINLKEELPLVDKRAFFIVLDRKSVV